MKTPHLIGLLALWLAYADVSWAQRTYPFPQIEPHTEPSRQWVVKFAALSLFDPDNTIQFGVERLFGQHNAVQLELGYGFQGMNLWQYTQNERYSNREVWRSRLEWRYYFTPTQEPRGRYIAIEGFYKQVNVRENGTVGVGCYAGPCQYYQQFSAPLEKYVWGGHIKYGRQFRLVPENNRLLADIYLGLGFRRRTIDRFQRPDTSYYYGPGSYNLFDSFATTPYTLISIAYGAKIGYAF